MRSMRVGVLEIGSNKVGLQVVDAQGGSAPLPAYALKTVTGLAQEVGPDGSIDAAGATRLYEAVTEASAAASEQGVDDLLVFATSALRDAPNVAAIRSQLADQTGVVMRVLSGEDEARLTFLAARRWFGWRAGRLLLLDIGGGSFEIAAGRDEAPDFAISLPLGAGRLTREFFSDDPPSKK